MGRTDPAHFVFENCVINGSEEYKKYPEKLKDYLGLPWSEYSRMVYINSKIDEVIQDDEFGSNKLFVGEEGRTGDGAAKGLRVDWSSFVPKDLYSREFYPRSRSEKALEKLQAWKQ